MTYRLEIHGVALVGVGPIDLSIAGGECVSLSGPSGAGKTLLLRAIADLQPHDGSVALDGEQAVSFPAHEWRRRVALLPAESQWWCERVGAHFGEVDEDALRALGFTVDVMTWEVARCSTGERQRLALLRSLQNRPRVLLLDEPTASLDPEATAAVERLISGYRSSEEAAVLWVSHDPAQARRIADRRMRIVDGRLTEEAA